MRKSISAVNIWSESSNRQMMEINGREEFCFPHLFNSSCTKPSLHWFEFVFRNIIQSFISLITAALNLLIIISVSHFRQLHTSTNILLLSLAVSDFLVGLLLMPLEIFKNTTCWFLGDVMCAAFCYLSWHVPLASVGNIILISIDRYIAICDPLQYSTRISRVRVKRWVCLSWLWYGLYSLFFMKDELVQPGRNNSCLGECVVFINYITGTIDLILNFIIPVTVIVFLYMRVFMVAVSQARAMRSHVTAVTLQHSIKLKTKNSELKAARTLGVLVVVYLICYCPYYIYSLVEVNLTSTSYASFLFFLFYFNSCLNPVIYALFYPWFRKTVKLIVTLQILQPGSCDIVVL